MLPCDFHFLENVYSKYSVPFANLFTGPLTFFVIPLTELIKSDPCVNLTSQRGQDRASWELVLTESAGARSLTAPAPAQRRQGL